MLAPMIVDPLTKGLLPKIFIGHVENMGIMCNSECWMVYVVINAFIWHSKLIIVQVFEIYVFYLMNVHANYDYDVENKLFYCLLKPLRTSHYEVILRRKMIQ